MNDGPTFALAWRLFRVHPGEGLSVLRFGLVAGLLQMGMAVGLTAADALFLTNVGVRGLPVVYVLTPLVMAVYIPAHTYLLGRLGIDRTMILTLAALALGGCGVWWSVHASPGAPAFYAAKLFAVLWWIGLYSLFWNWVDGFFDIQDAKRVYPLFSAGEAAGGVAGGALAAFLVLARPVEDLFLVWAALGVLAVPACLLINRRQERLETDRPDQAPGFVEQARRTAAATRRSRFVLIFGATLVTGLFIVTVTEYQYLDILSEGAGEEELAALLGTLFALVSVFNVAANLFLFNRVVLAVGVRNVVLIPAAAYIAVFALLLLEGGVAAAVFGFFTYHGILASIEYNNQNFLFHAIPDGVRREVRTVVEGLAEPMATALGGAFLLVAAPRMSPVQISSVGLGIAGLYLGLVFVLRGRYGPALTANLRSRWLDLSRSSEDILKGLSAEEMATLRERATDPDSRIALSALRILWLNDCHEAVALTLPFLRDRSEEDRQEARALLGGLLDRADPEMARPLAEWILANVHRLGPGFIEDLGARGLVPESEVAGLLDSTDVEEVAAAIVVVWHGVSLEARRTALERLLGLLAQGSTRAAGLRVLGHLRGEAVALEAARWLDDPDPDVRAAAALAVRETATPGDSDLVEPLLEVVPASERLAFTALEALARIGDPAAIPPVLGQADGFTPNVRRLVIRLLDRMGLKGVPRTVATLRDPSVPYEGRVLAARSLARLAPAQLEALVPEIRDTELGRAEEFRELSAALEDLDGPGESVLRRYYRDQMEHVTDYLLEILSAAGRVPDYAMLRRWLRGGTPREQADALETLEQALGRRDFARLSPLLRPSATGRGPGSTPPLNTVLEEAVEGRLGLGSAAAALALWERDRARARGLFARALRAHPSPILRDTILGLTSPDPSARLGPVRVVHRLENARFFGALPLPQLEGLVATGRERVVPEGARLLEGDRPEPEILVVLDGAVRTDPDGETCGVGSLIGTAGVLSGREACRDPVSLGCRVAVFPMTGLEAVARRSSHVAQALFALKEESRGAAA